MAIQDARAPATPTRATTRRFLPRLEGMRGLAAMGVLTTHVAFSAGQVRWNEAPGLEGAGNGVAAVLLQQLSVSLPIFFTLSGLLLYRPFAMATIVGTARPELKPYLWRRALRTLPAYWVMVLVCLVVLNRDAVTNVWQVLRPLLLLQIYSTEAQMSGGAGFEQAWSLCTEIAFYFLLPVLAWILDRLARGATDPVARARRVLLALAVPVAVGIGYTAWVHQPWLGLWPIQQTWAFGWIGFIAVGMALAVLSAAREAVPRPVLSPYTRMCHRPLLCWAGALLTYVLLCLSPVGDPGSANYPGVGQSVVELVGYQVFGLLVVLPLTVTVGGSRFIGIVLTNPVVLFLGRISYGVYLWHIALIYFVNGSMFGAPDFLVLWASVAGGSIALATVSYYVIEKPAMRLRERLGKATVEPSIATIAAPGP